MKARRVITNGSGSQTEIEYHDFLFHPSQLMAATIFNPVMLLGADEDDMGVEYEEDEEPIEDDGYQYDRCIVLHFRNGRDLEVVYHPKLHENLNKYFE